MPSLPRFGGHASGQYGLVLSAVLIAMLGWVPIARAEENASDRATARGLAGEGYAALQKKDYVTAEDRFRRADELVHAPTLVLDRARALVGLGRLGEAYAAYDSVIRETLPPNAPPVWKRAVKDATLEIDRVKGKVGWLIVQVTGASDPEVTINGQTLPARSFGERLPETPGELQVVASAPGYITQRVEQKLGEGEEKHVEIALLPVPEPAPQVVVVPATPNRRAPRPHDDPRKARRTLAYASFAVSGVGIAVGATTGILWLNARADIKSACGGLDCQPQNDAERARLEDDKRRYDTCGTLSVIGFGVGLAGAATGVALLLTQPEEAPPKEAFVNPYVGPGMLGVYGAFP